MADLAITWEQSNDRIQIHAGGGRFEIARSGGRWIHTLGFGAEPSLASSVELDPDRADPERIISPVYQELHRHEPAGPDASHPCLLLTGHAFKHIFSAAVIVGADAHAPGGIVVDVDVADRCREPVKALAATYLVRLGSSELAGADQESITWRGGSLGSATLELRAASPHRLVLAEAGRRETRVQVLANLDHGNHTHRLRYSWRWAVASASDSGAGRTR